MCSLDVNNKHENSFRERKGKKKFWHRKLLVKLEINNLDLPDYKV